MNKSALTYAKVLCIIHKASLRYARIYAYILENGKNEIVLDQPFKERIMKDLSLADITIRIAFSELEKAGMLKRMGRGRYYCDIAEDRDYKNINKLKVDFE